MLDEPIKPMQVDAQIHKIKVVKACGPDGLSPGVLTLLPAQWIVTPTTLFNNVFYSGEYPESWRKAKLCFTIFKRGD